MKIQSLSTHPHADGKSGELSHSTCFKWHKTTTKKQSKPIKWLHTAHLVYMYILIVFHK